MGLLPEEIKTQVRDSFADLKTPVKLVFFTQEFECAYCRETRQLLEEVAELSDMVEVEVYNFVTDANKVEEYGVDKIPATVIMSDKDYGLRFYGIPAGYEFTSLVHAIRLVGGADSQLDEATRSRVAALAEPVHMQVFVTPTCPYCPRSVVIAYEMAYASPMVRADAIEAGEFQHLAIKYQVAGVPRTVINDVAAIEGAAPPGMVMDKIDEALAAAQN